MYSYQISSGDTIAKAWWIDSNDWNPGILAAMILSWSAVQMNGFASVRLCSSMHRLMAACRSTRAWKTPCFSLRRLSLVHKPSTAPSRQVECSARATSLLPDHACSRRSAPIPRRLRASSFPPSREMLRLAAYRLSPSHGGERTGGVLPLVEYAAPAIELLVVGVKSFRAVAQIEIFSALTEPSGYNALSYSQLLRGAKP